MRSELPLWAIRGMGLALGVALVYALVLVGIAAARVFLLVFIAILLASALEPILGWLRERLPVVGRAGTILVVYLTFFVTVVGPRVRRRPGRDRPGRADPRRPAAVLRTGAGVGRAHPAGGTFDVADGPDRLGLGGAEAARGARLGYRRRGRHDGRGARRDARDAADDGVPVARRATPYPALRVRVPASRSSGRGRGAHGTTSNSAWGCGCAGSSR